MRNLFKFLKQFRNFSVFIVLQIFVLTLFFNSKNYHKASFFNSSSKVSGWLLEKRFNITKHFSLKGENIRLAEENADLLGKLPVNFYPLEKKIYSINDTLYAQQYEYFPAMVINYSNHKRNNYATINKGSVSGVEPDMGVITTNGIVGFVIDVSDHYAIVRTILSERTNITVEVNGVMGSLDWDGIDNEICKVKGITTSSKIEVGDQVIVKGSNGHFPRGIPVGEVMEVKSESGSATLGINIKIASNFHALGHVFIVNNIFKSEQESIEEKYYEE